MQRLWCRVRRSSRLSLIAVLTVSALALGGWRAVSLARVPTADTPCQTVSGTAGNLYHIIEQAVLFPERPEPIWMCLGYTPQLDAYIVILFGPDNLDEYRASKAASAARLQERGFDPCEVVAWGAFNRDALTLTIDDWLESPVRCAPHLVPVDSRAAAWLPAIRAGVDRIVAESAELTGVVPTRRLSIVLTGDPSSLIVACERYIVPFFQQVTADDCESGPRPLLTRRASQYMHYSAVGNALLINLGLDQNLRWDSAPDSMQAAFDRNIAHEYTHFIQDITFHPGFIPAWFQEGQARVVERLIGLRGGYESLVQAADARRNGKAPLLRELDSRSAVSPDGQIDDDVYVHGHAIVAYLVDRYGFNAMMSLLSASHNGDEHSFNHHLAALTGLSPEELDAAVGAWLLAPGRVLFREDFNLPSRYTPRFANDKTRKEQIGGEFAVTRFAFAGRSSFATGVAPLGDYQATVAAHFVVPTAGATLDLAVRLPHSHDIYIYRVDPVARAFAVERKTRDSPPVTVVDWTASSAIQGGTAEELFGVHTRAGRITFFANDQAIGSLLGETDAALPDESALALSVDHRTDGHTEVRFRSLTIANAD